LSIEMAWDSTTVALMVGSSPSSGPVRAMARDVVAEWRLAAACGDFRDLAGAGTRSDDRG